MLKGHGNAVSPQAYCPDLQVSIYCSQAADVLIRHHVFC